MDVLLSPWRKTSFTSPLPGAKYEVLVPEPNGYPACLIVLRRTSAWNVPAGTFTRWIPTIAVDPVTPKTEKSRLGCFAAQFSPGCGYAVRIGFIP